MKVALGFVAAAALLFLLVWMSLCGMEAAMRRTEAALHALDSFSASESALHRDVLSARTGMLRSYDALVAEVNAMRAALVELRVAAAEDREMTAALDELTRIMDRKEELSEQFKSKNALLQNSLTYFGIFSQRLSRTQHDSLLVQQVSSLATSLLHLTLDTSPAVIAAIDQQLGDISVGGLPLADADATHALLAHARMIRDLLPSTDGVIKTLFSLESQARQNDLRAVLAAREAASQGRAQLFWRLLIGLSLALAALLVFVGARLRSRAQALQVRSRLERVIAGISTRFINAQPEQIGSHVELALQELAACIAADRAYFVIAGDPPRVFQWSRPGLAFPPGWPARALEVAGQIERGPGDVIHVCRVAYSPHAGSGGVNALAIAGLDAWLCVPSVGKRYANGVLGFDAIGKRRRCPASEIGLLRMAFDAIANAVDREYLELEKGRLEASLQQARRMETIGALASGIAHNFNNIIGAIMGYSEIATAHVKPESRSAASLSEIRRVGERARDLVDQILTFGRRGDVTRKRVCLADLLAESKSVLDASLPHHVTIALPPPGDLVVVSAQPSQLQQVILNVCHNAAQAMDQPGTVTIAMTTRETRRLLRVGGDELEPGRYAIMSVSDPGRGMDEATRQRIFEPFFTTRLEGNGLGLSTAREIVREHGGAMTVQSAPGAGTRFDIWLPCAPAEGFVSCRQAATVSAATRLARGAGETVLVLEADRERLLGLEEVLAALGYEPVGFTRRAEAIAACRANPGRFDAALICHVGGAKSASTLAATLHQIVPSLPIVLATASVGNLDAFSLATAAIAELIHYPPTSADLLGALRRQLKGPRQAQGAVLIA